MLTFPENRLHADALPLAALLYWDVLSELEKTMLKLSKPNASYKTVLKLTNLENSMATARGEKKNDTTGRRNGKPADVRRDDVRWVNIRLDPTDQESLAASTADLSDLAALVCDVVGRGGQFGLKPMDGGNSFMAYFIGKPPQSNGTLCGISAYSDDPTSALLCLCYKFADKCAGEFPVPDSVDVVKSTRFR